MRDCYNRIGPDTEAWKKLGYVCTEVYGNTTYVFEEANGQVYDDTEISCDYNDEGTAEPVYYKERQWIDFGTGSLEPRCTRLDFTPEEQKQIEADLANWREEVNKK